MRPTGLSLTTTAFSAHGPIPAQFTCDGDDRSPALAWSGLPQGTVSLALIADDPDAPRGTWVHWVIYEIPASLEGLPEGVTKVDAPVNVKGALQGKNDFGRVGYGGPCPPPGPAHRYFFKLYALNASPGLRAGASKADLERAMHGHVLASAEIVGTYARARR